MKDLKACRIECSVYRDETKNVIEILSRSGISGIFLKPSRSVVLKEKKGFFGLAKGTGIEMDMQDILSFYVTPESEEHIIGRLMAEGKFAKPGNGSVFGEKIDLICSECTQELNKILPFGSPAPGNIRKDLAGFVCIVMKGEGDSIARTALDAGTPVPSVCFGEGTGLRNKLGLIRITFPAEKEIVNFTTGKKEAEDIFDALVEQGKLDQPGRGFIYYYPLSSGVSDTKIFRGDQKHAATMEQVIIALDDITGSNEWRKREQGSSPAGSARCLTEMTGITVCCNEGYAMGIIADAMKAGASGATLSARKYVSLSPDKSAGISPARESADLIVPRSMKEKIIEAVTSNENFTISSAVIEVRSVTKACTFLG